MEVGGLVIDGESRYIKYWNVSKVVSHVNNCFAAKGHLNIILNQTL